MLWLPAASAEVVKVAVPPLSVPVPRTVAPSLKVTVPVGVPVRGGRARRSAVKVTDCPETEGLADEVSVGASSRAWLTTWRQRRRRCWRRSWRRRRRRR